MNLRTLIQICIIVILGLTPLLWYEGYQFLGVGDFQIRFDTPKFLNLLSTQWDSTVSFGVAAPTQPAQFFLEGAVLATFHNFLPLEYIQRIIIVFYFTLSGFGTWLLLKSFGYGALARTSGALFYMMNPYTLTVIWHLPHGRIYEPYAWAPIVLLLFFKVLKPKTVPHTTFLWAGIIWLLASGAYSGPNYLLVHIFPAVLLAGLYLIHDINADENTFWRVASKYLIRGGFVVGVFTLLSAYWLLPFVAQRDSAIGASSLQAIMSDEESYYLGSVSVREGLQLQGLWSLEGDYKGDPYYSWGYLLNTPAYSVSLAILSLMLLIGVILGKKSIYTLYGLALFTIALLLITGPNNPLGFLNRLLYDSSDYISAGFRSPFLKFGILLSLGASILVAATVAYISRKPVSRVGVITLAILLLSYGYVITPFYTGDVISREGSVVNGFRVNQPKPYNDLREYLASNEGTGRIIILPLSKTNKTYVSWYDGGYFDKWFSAQHPVVNSDTGGYSSLLPGIFASGVELYRPDYHSPIDYPALLRLMDIKYILYHNDANWRYINGHSWYNLHTEKNTSLFLFDMTDSDLLKPVLQNSYFTLYEVQQYDDRKVYVPQTVTLFQSDVESVQHFFKQGVSDIVAGRDFVLAEDYNIIGSEAPFTHTVTSATKAAYSPQRDYMQIALPTLGNGVLISGEDLPAGKNVVNTKITEGNLFEKETFHHLAGTSTAPGGVSIINDGVLIFRNGISPLTTENGSFEDSISTDHIINASISRPGAPEYQHDYVAGGTDGKRYIQLSTQNHTVGVRVPISKTTKLSDCPLAYFLSYDSLTAPGNQSRLTFAQRGDSSLVSTVRYVQTTADWQTNATIVPASCINEHLDAYLYAELGHSEQAQVSYDNVRAYALYQLPYYVFITQLHQSAISNQQPKVVYVQNSATSYNVLIKGVVDDFSLVFADSYMSGWKLTKNNVNIGKHYRMNGYANAWYIDLNSICNVDNSCVRKPDGTFDLELQIDYFPQRWFYLGLLISGTTLVGCIGYLGYDFMRRRRTSPPTVTPRNK
jgi:hypothetical protein